ncbi:MAG: hypothetical protein RTU30_02220 [Candidatus Thorarchaeota archaeon]
MKNRIKILLGTILLAFMLGPAVVDVYAQGMMPGPNGPHDPGKIPQIPDDMPSGSVWINTDIITIKANEQFPSFDFWFTADENGTNAKFMLSYVSIAEFEDLNDDEAFQKNETLYFAPLAAYDWVLQTGSIEEDGVTTEVWLKYTKGGVRAGGKMPGFEPAMDGPGSVFEYEDVSIQIFAHIYLYDYDGNVTDDHGVKANYTVTGGSELKMDILIGNFPFSTNTSSVALETQLRENVADGDSDQNRHRYVMREQTRNMTGDSANPDPSLLHNETRFENREECNTQQMDFINTESGLTEGFFSWVDKAVITWPGGQSEAVDVTASYVPTMHGLSLYLAYPYFDNGSLLHDPSIGLVEDSAPLLPPDTPIDLYLVAGIGVVAILVIALVVVRKK